MKQSILPILFLLALLLFSCAHQKGAVIPKNIPGTPNDHAYWNAITNEAMDSRASILEVLEKNNPALLDQIIKDSKDPLLAWFWGKSWNYDSNAKQTIVDEKIMAELQGLFGVKNDNQKVHAGIIHTYGYLFSTLNTPYGFKRQRWIAPTLTTAFKLDSRALSPQASDGAFLSNVTYFMGKLAFKFPERHTQLAGLKNVANEIFTYNYDQLKRVRLEEELETHILVTTLVQLPNKMPGEENDYLLIYSSVDKRGQEEHLITAFPVNQESFKSITAPSGLGNNRPINLRYNAYIEDLGRSFIGRRRLIKD